METRANVHHLWWERKKFLSFNLSSQLRNHENSQVLMNIGWHNELHAQVNPIDPPEAYMARLALGHINSLPESYNALDTTRSLIDELYDTPMSEHLTLQMPFLILGVNALKRRIL